MSEELVIQERVRNTITLGESHFREFKSAYEGPADKKCARRPAAICKDIAEALVAFANSDGGELLIGVEDDGTITGAPHSEADISLMLSAPTTHTLPDTELPLSMATKLELNEKTVLYFSVTKGTTKIFQLSDGRCVCRRDKATVPETPEAIAFERQEVRSREYDRQFIDGASVSDLDTGYIQALADNYLRGLSVERYLQQLGLAEFSASGLRLRMAALLLFARDIQKYHPRSQVRILKISGTDLKSGEEYNVTSDEHVYGNILDLLVTSWEKLRAHLVYKTEFGEDARFVQKYLYPEGACREALVNAIAHRDYAIQNGIDVFIFNDRMEIRSPGALLSTLALRDLEALEGVHESRNSFIARALRENKFMRELGEGMKRMFVLMEESELELPKLVNERTSFTVVLRNKSIFSRKEEQWIDMFREFNLSSRQKRVVALGTTDREISPSDIYRAMNTEDRDTYDREVTALRKTGILVEVRTNPEATKLSRQRGVEKSKIPRFRVVVPEPSITKDISRGVFLANLPFDIEKQEIAKLFSACGSIVRVDLPTVEGKPRGFGFVWFDNPDSARRAMRDYDRYEIRGRTIKVDKVRPGTS